eukprot:3819488-Pleurochrysis_carterae.AAC.4
MPGFSPVSSSNDEALVLEGPLVRLSTSTACVTAKFQNAMGELLATNADRVNSMMERLAHSATPLSWCTSGGQVVLCTPASARNSVNSRERNSPALLL